MRILVVEDSVDTANAVRDMLVRAKFAVDVVSDGEAGLDCMLRGTYAAVVLDGTLPGLDGFSVCLAARAEGIRTPVLMLTARDTLEARVQGLDSGADDYMTKPFAAEELAARLRALLRRAERQGETQPLRVGDVTVDVLKHNARVGDRDLLLSPTEFRLLETLVRNHGRPLSRSQILEQVWTESYPSGDNIIDVYVSRLRRALKTLRSTVSIETVWGFGYRVAEGGCRRS
jgi:two-component system OmpR family response regulator